MDNYSYRVTPSATRQTEETYKLYVFSRLSEGDSFKAPRDIYNYISPQKGINAAERLNSRRVVDRFYPHYVLTHDDQGRAETYQYFDLYQILRENEGGKKNGI